MKFAETPISKQHTIYLRDEIRNVLEVGADDVLEWHLENGSVTIKKKEV